MLVYISGTLPRVPNISLWSMPTSASSLKSHSQMIRWTSQCFLRPSQWAICPLWSSSPVRSNFHHPFRVFPRTTRETLENIQNVDLQRSCFLPRFWIFLILEMVIFFSLQLLKTRSCTNFKLWSVFFLNCASKFAFGYFEANKTHYQGDCGAQPIHWLETCHWTSKFNRNLPRVWPIHPCMGNEFDWIASVHFVKRRIQPNLFGSVKLRSGFGCRKNYVIMSSSKRHCERT